MYHILFVWCRIGTLPDRGQFAGGLCLLLFELLNTHLVLVSQRLKNLLIPSRYCAHVAAISHLSAWKALRKVVLAAARRAAEMTSATASFAAGGARLVRDAVFGELVSRRLLREVADARGGAVREQGLVDVQKCFLVIHE